jgi:Ca-activated chloride channel homolog
LSHHHVIRGTLPPPAKRPRRSPTFATYLLRVCVLLCAAQAARGQPPQEFRRPRSVSQQAGQVIESDDVVRVDTDLVTLDVDVTDSAGKSVRGLRPEDFKLFEDGAERPLAFFSMGRKSDPTLPLAVVFALDTSGSMTPEEMARLRSAMGAFAERLAARPCVFAVMSFDTNVKRLQGFTDDRRKLDRAVERLGHENEGLSTHAYDAVDDAVRLLARAAPRERAGRLTRRVVIVVTDGFPVGDTVAPRTVVERANAAGVSVFTVTMPSYSWLTGSRPLPTPLDVSGLVELTGGLNVYATGDSYDELFRSLAEDVTSSYVLAFYPSDGKRYDGRFHAVRVEAPRSLTVRQSRGGYVGDAH